MAMLVYRRVVGGLSLFETTFTKRFWKFQGQLLDT